jgi:hypothetical protein
MFVTSTSNCLNNKKIRTETRGDVEPLRLEFHQEPELRGLLNRFTGNTQSKPTTL